MRYDGPALGALGESTSRLEKRADEADRYVSRLPQVHVPARAHRPDLPGAHHDGGGVRLLRADPGCGASMACCTSTTCATMTTSDGGRRRTAGAASAADGACGPGRARAGRRDRRQSDRGTHRSGAGRRGLGRAATGEGHGNHLRHARGARACSSVHPQRVAERTPGAAGATDPRARAIEDLARAPRSARCSASMRRRCSSCSGEVTHQGVAAEISPLAAVERG